MTGALFADGAASGAATVDGVEVAEGVVAAVAADGAVEGLVAEGVETETQRQFLLDEGCHYGQGYLFNKPLRAAEMQQLLQAHERQQQAG